MHAENTVPTLTISSTPTLGQRTAKRSRKRAADQTLADARLAAAYRAFHACRLRLWEALAQAAALPEGAAGSLAGRLEFRTEREKDSSARTENSGLWADFKFQPRRQVKEERQRAGVRNLGDYPADMRDRDHGWLETLSAGAAELAERAHGYLEYVAVRGTNGEPVPLLTERGGRLAWGAVFGGLWVPLHVAPLPPAPPLRKHGPDLTGRIYAREAGWRTAVAQVSPQRVPLRAGAGAGEPAVNLEAATSVYADGAGKLHTDPADLHPIAAFIAARTILYALVARLETCYVGRFLQLGRADKEGCSTMPDRNASLWWDEGAHGRSDLPREAREELLQEVKPYTFRALESWHPARGCFSTYLEYKVRHALRNQRLGERNAETAYSQEHAFISGLAERHAHSEHSVPGVSETLVAGVAVEPGAEGYLEGRERLGDPSRPLRPAARTAAAAELEQWLADQRPGAGSVRRRRPTG